MANRYMPMLNLSGQTIGDLIVLDEVPRQNAARARRWRCRCKCGREVTVQQGALRRRHTLSCGCRRTAVNKRRWTTHGLTESVEYGIWLNIKNRCYNKRGQDYARYGGRGIRMSKAWRENFTAFLADMGKRPTPRHQVDRRENDGPYALGNCRWASPEENSNNRSTNRPITFRGETRNVRQWARHLGLSETALRLRLNRGWPVERALTEPVRHQIWK